MSGGHFASVTYHRRLLRDRARTKLFRDAISELVSEGDVVVEVGAGSGILSMFAAEAGASKVYAIESAPIARVAAQVVIDNGFEDVIEVIEEDARTVELPEQCHVLVSECIGNFVLSDGMLEVLESCRRFLRPEAVVCPDLVQLFVAPAYLEPMFDVITWWDEPRYGFDFSAAKASAMNDVYALHVPEPLIKAPAQEFGRVRLTREVPAWGRKMKWPITEACVIDGLVGWFVAELSPSFVLDAGPDTNQHWGQLLFPLPRMELRPGDELRIELVADIDDKMRPLYRWHGCVVGEDGTERGTFSHDQVGRYD